MIIRLFVGALRRIVTSIKCSDRPSTLRDCAVTERRGCNRSNGGGVRGSYTDLVPVPLEPGATFAGYVIERHLGEGGMGEVYQARHPELGKSFALKILPAALNNDPSFALRFKREMETVSRLDHPNIVMATDGGSFDGQVWFAMTYVPGTDAQGALAASEPRGLPPERVAHIVENVGAALDYAHRRGVLHRDIKPANILLAPKGENDDERVYLTDFGIAKAIDDLRPITRTNQAPMTLDFASPEQILGNTLDARTDIYSLGATLFSLLTGRVPFPAASNPAKMLKHLDEAPPLPTAVVPDLPPAFDAVVTRAMAKDPDDRYQTCRDLALAVRAAIPGHTRSDPCPADTTPTMIEPPASVLTLPAPPPPSVGSSRRRRLLLTIAIVCCAIGIVGVGTFWANSERGATIGYSSSPLTPTSSVATVTSAAETSVSSAATVAGPAAADSAGSTGSTPSGGRQGVQPLGDLLNPAPEYRPGRVGGTALASAASYSLQPKNCPRGTQQITADLNRSFDRVTGTVQLDEAAPATTRARLTATADGEVLQQAELSPTEGATFDLDVKARDSLVFTLETAGQGSCESDGYLAFVTSALAYPSQP